MANKASSAFSAEEKAAMRAAVAESKRAKSAEADAAACAEAIAAMAPSDRTLAEKVHAIVTGAVPALLPKTWYGMPAYTNEEGKVVCFFKPALKFKSRYRTLGFEDAAQLDDGTFWTTSYAITGIGAAEEKTIAALVKKAAGA